MWICEFCEYEDIFGVPPVALIRQYEVKDRAERKRQAEKRRLLEKAKAKGRKGKKGNKKGNNNANNNNAALNQQGVGGQGNGQLHQYDPNMPPEVMGDEYYDDDEFGEGDEYEPMGPEEEEGIYGDQRQYYPPNPPGLPGHAKGGGG